MRIVTASLLALIFAAPAAALVPDPAMAPLVAGSLDGPLAPLRPLLGEWDGEGWIMTAAGKEQFRSYESVTSHIGGNAVLVQGVHRSKKDGRVVHNAMAMINRDAATGAMRFRSALANGMSGDFPFETSPGRYLWVVDTPRGKVEYDARFTDSSWVEHGRLVGADGKRTDIFEMRLTRRSAAR